MKEQIRTNLPSTKVGPASTPATEAVMLMGMKILFDDKVGLYPVDLVAQPTQRRGDEGKPDGRPR